MRIFRLRHLLLKNKSLPSEQVRIRNNYITEPHNNSSCLSGIHQTKQKINQNSHIRQLFNIKIDALSEKKDSVFNLFPSFLWTDKSTLRSLLSGEIDQQLQCLGQIGEAKNVFIPQLLNHEIKIRMNRLLLLILINRCLALTKSSGKYLTLNLTIRSTPLIGIR